MDARIMVLSLKPRWLKKVLSGEKTIEIRRRAPILKDFAQALIYETSPACQLRARCIIGIHLSGNKELIWRTVGEKSCLQYEEYNRYLMERPQAIALFIKGVEELSKPLSLSHLRQEVGFHPPQSWSWAKTGLMQLVEANR